MSDPASNPSARPRSITRPIPSPVFQRWVRSRVRKEAFASAGEGAFFLAASVIVFSITSYCAAFALFFALRHFAALFYLVGIHFNPLQPVILASLFLLVLILSFHGAYREKLGGDYSAMKLGYRTPVSADLFQGTATLVCEIFFSGPRMLFNASESFAKTSRLLRLDISETSAILMWLYVRHAKAAADELITAFPGFNTIQVVTRMRDLSDIIWLPGNPSVILLAAEFRTDFSDTFGQDQQNQPGVESPGEPIENDAAPNGEIISWYEALGLSPFAPLAEVKRSYRYLVKIHHPDARRENSAHKNPEDDGRIKEINEAYHCIMKHSH